MKIKRRSRPPTLIKAGRAIIKASNIASKLLCFLNNLNSLPILKVLRTFVIDEV